MKQYAIHIVLMLMQRNNMDNSTKLIKVVSDVLGISADVLYEKSNNSTLEEWDSLSVVNIVTEIESVFDVQFDILEIAGFDSIENVKSSLINKGIIF